MAVCMLYWSLIIAGALDLDMFTADGPDADVDVDVDMDVDPDLDLDADAELGADASSGGLLSSMLDALAIGTVPVTIVVSFITAFGWISSLIAETTIAPMARELVGAWIYGGGMLAATFLFAVWLTTLAVKPLKPAFITVSQHGQEYLIGRTATVTSSKVTSTFGLASLPTDDGTTSLQLNIVCQDANRLATGDEVTLLDYDEAKQHYAVMPLGPNKLVISADIAVDANMPPPGAQERLPAGIDAHTHQHKDSTGTPDASKGSP